jgi:histidyl-tRNA synthetase
MSKIPPVKGTRDFYPEQMAVRNWIMAGWREASIRNGFVEFDGPIFEYLQLYTQKSGDEIASQLFSLTDRGGRDLAIRPEITPTLARMVNQQINALPRPIKWFSVPRLCRAERPQRGRLREFFQWNIDIVGSDSILADAECIYTAIDYLRSVGLTSSDIIVKISSRAMLAALLLALGFPEDQLNKIYALLDKRAKLPAETFAALAAEQIPDAGLREKLMQLEALESLDQITPLATTEQAQQTLGQLRELFDCLKIMNVADYCAFDIKIVRGLAYYTGPVFEIFDRGNELRALCGGGRYDNLLAGLGGPQVPATGFGMGDVVLEILLTEKNLLGSIKNQVDFFVIDADPSLFQNALALVSQLRAKGLSAAFDYKRSPLGKQLKQASAQYARFALILGQETIQNREITLKNLSEGSQKTLPLEGFLAQTEQVLGTLVPTDPHCA